MSRNDNTNHKGQAATFEDDVAFAESVNYGADDAFTVTNGDPNYHYFLAANDGDKDRPDGVHQVKLMGYREAPADESVKVDAGCKLMRIPRQVFDARRKTRRDARLAARKAKQRPEGVPAASVHETGNAMQIPVMRSSD